MKTKLTLTIRKEIIEKAKQKAASRGVSLSQLFEEVFDLAEPELNETDTQKAAKSLLKRLESMKPMPSHTETDKGLRRRYLEEKFG